MSKCRRFALVCVIIALGGLGLIGQEDKNDLIVHEWGVILTDTKGGATLATAIHNEEKDLPEFVFGRKPKPVLPPGGGLKGKPLLYFYTNTAPKQLEVKVSFPKGNPLYWWPEAEVGKGEKGGGHLKWAKVNILKPEDKLVEQFKGVDKGNWFETARDTESCIVEVINPASKEKTYERFLYYDTIDSYKPALKISSKGDKVVVSGKAKNVFIVRNKDGEGGWTVLPEVNGEKVIDSELKKRRDISPSGELIPILTKAGLYEKEARGMAKIWENGFFEKEGLRAIYLLPQEEYDKISVLEMNPKPKEIKRVILVTVEGE